MKIWAGLFVFLSACAPLEEVGLAPSLTQVGASIGLGVSPERMAISVPPPVESRRSYSQGSLWNSGPTSLFGDRRARHLGDIMTVVIEIDDKAQISNRSGRSRTGAEGMSINELLGLENLTGGMLSGGADISTATDFSSNSSSSGEGSVSRNEKITLRVAATVVNVLDNGHLVIQGAQEVRVNFELRELQVAGIVRPEDISRRNEITYDKIAGARISYGGRGRITDVQQPRYGQQIYEIIAPF